MYRLILLALLCLPLAMFSQEQLENQSNNEIGINLNYSDYSGLNSQLVYKRFLNPKNALRFTIGGNAGYTRTIQASLGLRHILLKYDKFELHTGFDVVYEKNFYKNGFIRPDILRDFSTLNIEIPLGLSYSVGNGIFITSSISKTMNLYNSIFSDWGQGLPTGVKLNLGISKRF